MFTLKQNNDKGIDFLMLAVEFIPVIESRSSLEFEVNYNSLKKFIEGQLNRKITQDEELGLLKGIKDYILSKPVTNERNEAMEYLFESKFLKL